MHSPSIAVVSIPIELVWQSAHVIFSKAHWILCTFIVYFIHNCNTLFVLTTGFGFRHLGGHTALAAWAGLRVMLTAPFPLFIEHIFCHGIMLSLVFKEVSGCYRVVPSGRSKVPQYNNALIRYFSCLWNRVGSWVCKSRLFDYAFWIRTVNLTSLLLRESSTSPKEEVYTERTIPRSLWLLH